MLQVTFQSCQRNVICNIAKALRCYSNMPWPLLAIDSSVYNYRMLL